MNSLVSLGTYVDMVIRIVCRSFRRCFHRQKRCAEEIKKNGRGHGLQVRQPPGKPRGVSNGVAFYCKVESETRVECAFSS